MSINPDQFGKASKIVELIADHAIAKMRMQNATKAYNKAYPDSRVPYTDTPEGMEQMKTVQRTLSVAAHRVSAAINS